MANQKFTEEEWQKHFSKMFDDIDLTFKHFDEAFVEFDKVMKDGLDTERTERSV